ncbi:DUF302 domain-containing protein [Rhizobium sp. Rhizsp82]|uniref:DUF302 domain-containing protein n=1 Tax=Rhizobium sp. Rhizsp82 TaxID=3243057 RepID=UPI0039B68DC7
MLHIETAKVPVEIKLMLSAPKASYSHVSIRHVELRCGQPARKVHEKLLASIPRLSPRLVQMLRSGDLASVEKERRDGPPLWLFEVRDMGSLLAMEGVSPTVYQYEIGNPLTAESMIRYQLSAALYAPLRVILYDDAKGCVFAFDQPSDFLGQFGDDEVTDIGHSLDGALEHALQSAMSAAALNG